MQQGLQIAKVKVKNDTEEKTPLFINDKSGDEYMRGTKDNSNLDEIFREIDNKEMAKSIAKMYDTLGHEKFCTVIKITMYAVELKREKGKEVNFTELKEILEGAMKIANGIYGVKRVII